MSKLTKQQEEQLEELAEMFDETFDDDDYVFVLRPDGSLKTIMLPDETPFAAPKNVNKILKMFGLLDIDNVAGNATIH